MSLLMSNTEGWQHSHASKQAPLCKPARPAWARTRGSSWSQSEDAARTGLFAQALALLFHLPEVIFRLRRHLQPSPACLFATAQPCASCRGHGLHRHQIPSGVCGCRVRVSQFSNVSRTNQAEGPQLSITTLGCAPAPPSPALNQHNRRTDATPQHKRVPHLRLARPPLTLPSCPLLLFRRAAPVLC